MSFNICIMKNPFSEWTEDNRVSNWDENEGDHHLDFEFDGKDFQALQNFLGIKLNSTEQDDSEDYDNYLDKVKDNYYELAKEKNYEMLGRIWDWFHNVSFFPSEITQLLEECLRFNDKAQNPDQVVASDKLIKACHEAIKHKSGIFLGSD